MLNLANWGLKMTNYLFQECKLLLRSQSFRLLAIILVVLSIFAVGRGIIVSKSIETNVAKIEKLQLQEREAIKRTFASTGDAGYTAYYGFELIKTPPNHLNFITLGQSDLSPQSTRIRSLALLSQIYEGEIINPESLVKGRFDYSFLVVFILPLFIIAALFDLRSNEAEAAREGFLKANANSFAKVLIVRGIMRLGMILVVTLVPLYLGAALNNAPILSINAIALYIFLYSLFLGALCAGFIISNANSRLSALGLLAIWSILLIAAPILLRNWVNNAIPANQGFAIALEHREVLHGAWERNRQEEVNKFLIDYPQFSGTPKLGKTFEWKWYYAFHNNADKALLQKANQYTNAIRTRYYLTKQISYFLPPVALQLAIEETTNNSFIDQLQKQAEIAKKHKALREFYYPYLFNGEKFTESDYDRMSNIGQ